MIGGTSGLGLSATKAFVREGARVVVVGRSTDKVRAVECELGSSVVGLAADAMQPDTATRAIALAAERLDGFHGLYHVAGGSGRKQGDGALHELTDEGWQFTLNENLTSLLYSNRAAVQQFLAQGRGGSVLNMGSVLGWSPSPHLFATHAYATAKAGIIGLTQAAAAHYAKDGVRFNVLAPALVATPMAKRAATDERVLKFTATKQPLDGGRIGQPEDTDAAAVFFLSDAARFVTGQVLAVDGGWTVSEGQIPD